MYNKRISRLAVVSFITGICSVFLPFLIGAITYYLQYPVPWLISISGIYLGIRAFILGLRAIIAINKNRSTTYGYTRAIIGMIIGLLTVFSLVNDIIRYLHK